MTSARAVNLNLPPRHLRALAWFHQRAGQAVPWPKAQADGTFLVTRAKGIYKPVWTEYALSVRQGLESPYPDHEPTTGRGGAWTFHYFQEDLDPDKCEEQFTNKGLLACQRDSVPVGVLRQVKRKPDPRYEVLGLGLVSKWEGGYFTIIGIDVGKALDLTREA